MDTIQTNSSASRDRDQPLDVVLITVPDDATARELARGLVSQKLAACVNIIPSVTSIYQWEGKITEDAELLCIVKTRASLLEELAQWVQEHHPYEVPEVVALESDFVHRPYLEWALSATKERGAG